MHYFIKQSIYRFIWQMLCNIIYLYGKREFDVYHLRIHLNKSLILPARDILSYSFESQYKS